MDKPWWAWALFGSLVITLLVLDLGVFHKDQHEIRFKESLSLCGFYMMISVLFGLWIGSSMGLDSMSDYFTGYLIEQSLSLDNVFIISLIFSYFAIPSRFQHRVLFWGILGVVLFRGILIFIGSALVERFHWMLYLFSIFLVVVGIKMLFIKNTKPDIARNPILNFLRKHWCITDEIHGQQFLVKLPHPKIAHRKVWWATPLLIALIMVECVDLVFAIDSVPAIFAITTDPYIVYTSNIFAILGLRALYFALNALLDRFIYLQYALAAVLIFIGSKIFVVDISNIEKFPSMLSLAITFTLLATGVIASILKAHLPATKQKRRKN